MKQSIKYDKDYNITHYSEIDSNGSLLYEITYSYYKDKNIRKISDSNGHIRTYGKSGLLIKEVGKPIDDSEYSLDNLLELVNELQFKMNIIISQCDSIQLNLESFQLNLDYINSILTDDETKN